MTTPMNPDRLAHLTALADAHGPDRDTELAAAAGEMLAEIRRLQRAAEALAHSVGVAVVSMRAAWVEGERRGAQRGLDVLQQMVVETAAGLPPLKDYADAAAVFDAELPTRRPQ